MASPSSEQTALPRLPQSDATHRAGRGPRGTSQARLVLGATAMAGLLLTLIAAFSGSSNSGWRPFTAAFQGKDPSGADRQSRSPSLIESAQAKVDDGPFSTPAELTNGLAPLALGGDAYQQVVPLLGDAEAKLIDIYRSIGQGQHRQALVQAERLAAAHPNFQLAQLVLGDLLSLQTRPVRQLGDVPDTKALAAQTQLAALREESRRRLRALTERPPEGRLPSQILSLAPQSRHAIAVDASRSRLYLFENLTPPDAPASAAGQPRLRLIGDYYISVGLSGIEKQIEGDQRTPLGVYYITGNLNPANLPDLYGAGALPINYPNALDVQRGKTGHGIWLHGTPRAQFVRAPQASDGCVVLSNPDLQRLLATVAIKTTPVIIAPELHWVDPGSLSEDRADFDLALAAWQLAKSRGELDALKALYSDRFRTQGRDSDQWWLRTEQELRLKGERQVRLSGLSLLRWRDSEDTMVVSFSEALEGQSRTVNKRQYWSRENGQWKIFFEGPVG
jgi:L,D-transpeptidase YnhG